MRHTFALVAALLIPTFGASQAATAGDASAKTDSSMRTEWKVRSAAGMDALLIIGAAGGDVMQSHYYPETIAYVRDNISAEGVAAMDELDAMLRQRMGRLTGPSLASLFSAGPIATIDDVIASAEDPVGRLRAGNKASPRWNEKEFENATRSMPIIREALVALRDMGFTEWYAREHQPAIDKAIDANLSAV